MNRIPRPSSPRRTPPSAGFLSTAGGLLGTLLRLAAGVLAFVLMLGALLVGAALALGLVTWAVLRGRRPRAQVFTQSFQRMRRTPGPAFGTGPAPGRSSAAERGAVVDVEAREVPDDGRPTTTLRPDR